MLRQKYFLIAGNPVWSRVTSFSLILFFIFLADAILSYWVPNFIEDTFQSSFVMGLIMGFSSLMGLLADLILPQIIKASSIRKMILLGVFSSLIFSGVLMTATYLPILLIFLLAMAVWGIYYEFLGFASQLFVSDYVPLRLHSSVWAILGVFKNLAYFLGPLLAAWLLARGDRNPLFMAIVFALLSLSFILVSKKSHKTQGRVNIKKINILSELGHWKTLLRHVWPVVIMSLTIGFIDAAFWTSGAVLSETLARENFLGSLILPAYSLPSLIAGFAVAKMGVYKRKKKKALVLMLAAGFTLSIINVFGNTLWLLTMVLMTSSLLSFSFPLIEGVYSDIIARMGRERQHLIGLSNSTFSIAYIIGPILAGFISQNYGEKITFSLIGMGTFAVAVILLWLTPKKLKLPQKELQKWKS